jgi:amidase
MWDGIGYKLALPEPRHDSLAEYRVLLIDAHPLCPTAVSIKEALDRLTDRLGKSGCTIVRASPKMPDLARTTRNYSELLLALFRLIAPDERARIEAAANALSSDDQSSTAARLRGSTMSHAACVRTNRIGSGLRARWQALFQDVDVILCPPMLPHDHSPPRTRQLDLDDRKIPYYDQLPWAAVATLTGLPATVVPNRAGCERAADRRSDYRRLPE